MVMATESEVKAAIRKIIADEKSYKTSLNWAVSYCWAAMSMQGYALRAQVPYILNNITRWRHPDAKGVRKVLREFSTQGG
jgi:hypothetical protein